jgi:hypothetical protein
MACSAPHDCCVCCVLVASGDLGLDILPAKQAIAQVRGQERMVWEGRGGGTLLGNVGTGRSFNDNACGSRLQASACVLQLMLHTACCTVALLPVDWDQHALAQP